MNRAKLLYGSLLNHGLIKSGPPKIVTNKTINKTTHSQSPIIIPTDTQSGGGGPSFLDKNMGIKMGVMQFAPCRTSGQAPGLAVL